ncbi:hypothetical protein JAAARDRAFT_68266 [Jaapia argillacea MUCL 33604]|uniref:Uncharacterized protein n=1 Tax=Jaapia argillacea MUCL 33604 TaxID=933084 RepID=A0A067QAQ1_9AGAM|nr:hypothetical protein JAAARDRAFT_68266 [Jaapia argillacea MUCL 33604]
MLAVYFAQKATKSMCSQVFVAQAPAMCQCADSVSCGIQQPLAFEEAKVSGVSSIHSIIPQSQCSVLISTSVRESVMVPLSSLSFLYALQSAPTSPLSFPLHFD